MNPRPAYCTAASARGGRSARQVALATPQARLAANRYPVASSATVLLGSADRGTRQYAGMPSTPARPSSGSVDCLVVGGGPAGLSAAIQLGRMCRSCVIADDDAGRSLWSQVTRNHLGFPDGISATDLRLLGQEQAVRYGADLRGGRVVRLRRDRRASGGFVATIEPRETSATDATPGLPDNQDRERRHAAGLGERASARTRTIRARTVLLATGVVDAFPAFSGRDECVGVSLFWCIVCDGYEAIGRHVAVVGDDEDALETAFGLLHFTDRVTLVTGRRRTRAPRQHLRALEERGVSVRRTTVAAYCHRDGRMERLELGDDDDIACDMVFVSAPKRARTELGRRLGAATDEAGYLEVDPEGRTSVPGLFAAGDVTAGHAHQVSAAAHGGATAATAVNYELYDPVERGEA